MGTELTYEMECMRAELLGHKIPEKEEFERKLAEQLKTQQSDLEIEECKILEEESENINRTHGKLDELNTILSDTQKKINNFKRTACGSISKIFKNQSVDKVDTETNIDNFTPEKKEMILNSRNEPENNIRDNNFKVARNESLDINKKMNSHLDTLDSLIKKTETAELTISSQTKQMKKFTK